MEKENEEYMLFAPKSIRGLKVDYPELSGYEEFKMLRGAEMLFVWYFGCKSSPYFNTRRPELAVIKLCVEAAGLTFDDEKKRVKFMAGNFPEKVETGIKMMNTFEPSIRIIAKRLAVKMAIDIKKLISLELDANGNNEQFINKAGEVDFTKKKQYQDMILAASAKLGDIVEKAEKGFSITSKEKTVSDKNRDDSGDSFAESFHNDN